MDSLWPIFNLLLIFCCTYLFTPRNVQHAIMKHLALVTLFSSAVSGSLRGWSQPDLHSRSLQLREDGQKAFELVHSSGEGYFLEISLGESQTMTFQVRSDTFYSWVPASNSSTCDEGSCEHGSCELIAVSYSA